MINAGHDIIYAAVDVRSNCGFEYYGSKHLENTLTKFIQVYWFYHKFNVDKRKSHLSSMIVSDQLKIDQAVELLKQPIYDENIMQEEIKYILSKIDLDIEEFNNVMNIENRQHYFYKTSLYNRIRNFILKIIR